MCTTGAENYENQEKYGLETFEELMDLNTNGYVIEGEHHDILVVSCSDWKACACIEGITELIIHKGKSSILTFCNENNNFSFTSF